MDALIFGATGMIGRAVLRECRADSEVGRVLTIGRTLTGQQDRKVRELAHADLLDYSGIEGELSGFDACLFCLGAASAGMTEAAYTRVTHDITLAAANALLRLTPRMSFIYVSGAGADSTESGRTMWARVRGRTENALLALPFKSVYVLRPAIIQPMHGIQSKTRSYRLFYSAAAPLLPALRALFPNYVTSTERLARLMVNLAKHGGEKNILEARDINRLSAALMR